jgi:hypothetical protein
MALSQEDHTRAHLHPSGLGIDADFMRNRTILDIEGIAQAAAAASRSNFSPTTSPA